MHRFGHEPRFQHALLWTPRGLTPIVPGLSAATLYGLFIAVFFTR
jgi:hypothetical protein